MAATSPEDVNDLIKQWETFEKQGDTETMCALLMPHKDTKNPEILWRLAMSVNEKGKKLGGDQKKSYTFQAFDIIKQALELDDKNYNIHMWYGVLVSEVSEYEGTKQRIASAFTCKEHFLAGLELNPTSSVLLHCMGFWCFEVADMSWIERNAATVLFAKPPTSTFEEALQYFEDSEKAGPDSYNPNNVMLAKTLLKLKKDKDRAKDCLIKATKFDAKWADDIEAKETAKTMLKKEFSIKI